MSPLSYLSHRQVSPLAEMLSIASLDFDLPPELEASEPPEARGLARDEVRLMVSYCADNREIHTRFRNLGTFLDSGDLLVINTSGTMNASLSATRADGTMVENAINVAVTNWIKPSVRCLSKD